jgi:ankyrin repeat protein
MKRLLRYFIYLFAVIGFSPAVAGSSVDFFRAVNVDNAPAVQNLLAQGFDPNTPSELGQGALFLALRDGSPKVAAVLLADPRTAIDTANASGETPLMMAALRGNSDWNERLLARGAQLNRSGWTALHYAATGPSTAVVALLLSRGAALEAPSPNGTTPLMMAARYGPEDSVNLLLARGASLTARNVQGLNAADFAALDGRNKLAARLRPAER